MSKKCYRCKENEAKEKYGNISFSYQGMRVKIFRVGGLCKECAKAEWLEDFEKNAKEFIDMVNGKPKVNWKRYHEYFKMRHSHDKKEKFHSLLVDLNILSSLAQGNWEIVAYGPIGISPRSFASYLYFIKKEDAIEFARLENGRTQYSWEIHHIDEVIPKQRVLNIREV